MTSDVDRLDLDEEVAQLCDPYQHRERRLVRGRDGRQRAEHHLTEWPSLLEQLRIAEVEPLGQTEDVSRRVPRSTPPGNFGALAALLRIEASAARWMTDRLRVTPRETAERNIRYLLGAAYGMPVFTGRITSDVHKWWTWARIESLWERGPVALGDPCPWCLSQTLRVRLGEIAEKSSGWCTECEATWEGVEVRVLGRIIEAARIERARVAAEAREQARLRRHAEMVGA